MWWAELAVGLAGSAMALTVIMFLVPLAARRPMVLDAGPSALLIALSIGVGIFVSGRFRAWGLRRQASTRAKRS